MDILILINHWPAMIWIRLIVYQLYNWYNCCYILLFISSIIKWYILGFISVILNQSFDHYYRCVDYTLLSFIEMIDLVWILFIINTIKLFIFIDILILLYIFMTAVP